MALSNGSYANSGPLVFLSPRSKTKDENGKAVELQKPYFEISRVNEEGNIYKTGETATVVSGDLVSIKFKIREFEGKKTSHIILYIKDNSSVENAETYSLDLNHRISSRSLFNALLNLESPKGIAVSIYRSKKGYESFGLEQNGENVKWKYELTDLPKAEVMRNKKGEVVQTDYSEVDAFFEEKLKELAESFGFNTENKGAKKEVAVPTAKETVASNKTTAKTVSKNEKPAPADQNDDDSVPF